MVTSIVDIHKKDGKRPPFDVYIGRAVRYTEFTQNSIWYNPFKAPKDEAELIPACLLKYEAYIRQKIYTDPKKYDLSALVNKKLGCWCVNATEITPLRCHGQILLKLIREKGLDA